MNKIANLLVLLITVGFRPFEYRTQLVFGPPLYNKIYLIIFLVKEFYIYRLFKTQSIIFGLLWGSKYWTFWCPDFEWPVSRGTRSLNYWSGFI